MVFVIFCVSFLLWMGCMLLCDFKLSKCIGTALMILTLPFVLLFIMIAVPVVLLFDKNAREAFKEQQLN